MLVLPSRKNSRNLLRFDDIDFTEYEHPYHSFRKGCVVDSTLRKNEELSGIALEIGKRAANMVSDLKNGDHAIVRSGRKASHSFSLLTKSKEVGCIAIAEDGNPQAQQKNLVLIFFPEPEHAAAYYHAGQFSLPGGPATLYPGSVGSLKISFNPDLNHGSLNELQSSAKHSMPAVNKILTGRGRNLSNVYLHWKSELSKLAMDFFERLGVQIISVNHQDLYDPEGNEEAIDLRIITTATTAFNQTEGLRTCNDNEGAGSWKDFVRN